MISVDRMFLASELLVFFRLGQWRALLRERCSRLETDKTQKLQWDVYYRPLRLLICLNVWLWVNAISSGGMEVNLNLTAFVYLISHRRHRPEWPEM